MADKNTEVSSTRSCAQCSKPIKARVMLFALDQYWHEDCLKCTYCNKRLYEISNKLYLRGELILCKRDYIRLFGATGMCSLCFKAIPPLENVMRAREHVFHLDCFACQFCGYRFCIGDKFFLYQSSVLCQDDYEDLISNIYPLLTPP
ncbi:rhombotin-1-like [Actinia tenebrosa]|uniref:Rhombotin-1-like n=1 Tax=Actinia tenebrosa TaxID=6105 RepID=A0A6P8IRU9_ACTTE|nr:rhombotin-1-like [Actinia tenebrosa]